MMKVLSWLTQNIFQSSTTEVAKSLGIFGIDAKLTKENVMKTIREWAVFINGREYRKELTVDEIREMRADGIIATYGASE